MDVVARCAVDESVERVVIDGVAFPLGVYPVEPIQPRQGYAIEFEPADGDESEGEWEVWPDRYVFDVVITAERLQTLCSHLFAEMPGRVYPILDFIGHDAFREIDPYISYELVGADRFIDAVRRYRAFFFEDGMCGFGALCDDPFFYIFVDEHKIVTIRVDPDQKERIERILAAFDLAPVEEPAGADAAAHEHRGVLLTPQDRPDLLSAEEIVESLRDEWQLALNVDPEANIDDQGFDLGLTAWRCMVRLESEDRSRRRYGESLVVASSLAEAEDLAIDAVAGVGPDPADGAADEHPVLITADRLSPAQLQDLAAEIPAGEWAAGAKRSVKAGSFDRAMILAVRWLPS